MTGVVLSTQLSGMGVRHGKVRDIYDLGDNLLLVSTDRISAFDWILPTGIPDKGRLLTQLSRFWFDRIDEPNHLLSTDIDEIDLPDGIDRDALRGRSTLVRKTEVVPFECVVRGYLAGSGWKEYQQSGRVAGIELPQGLVESDQLPEPIFTPATKAAPGEHDENITFAEMSDQLGRETADTLRERSLAIYQAAADYARHQGILIADTKFEFGRVNDEIILIDEVLTPDSSRFWPADKYQPGHGQPSFDKQYVRDWLLTTDWDKNSPPPHSRLRSSRGPPRNTPKPTSESSAPNSRSGAKPALNYFGLKFVCDLPHVICVLFRAWRVAHGLIL